MQAQKATAEERLLRLIESGNKGADKLGSWNVNVLAARFSLYTERVRRLVRVRFAAGLARGELNIKLINWGLTVLLVLLGAGIVWNMNPVWPSLKDFSTHVASEPPVGEEQAVATLTPLDDHLSEVAKRDLFNPFAPALQARPEVPAPKAEPLKPPEPVQPPKPTATALEILREKAKSLKLVGVAWGNTPVAMIEDTAKRETAFFKVGQSINEIEIKAILKDRAILSYGNAEFDLF